MKKELINPREKYTSEKFEDQEQEGKSSHQNEMYPKPDCGEKSYKGTGKLKGRNALITGGDSGIGRAVAIAFSREGAEVAVHYYPEDEEDAQDLKKFLKEEGKDILLLPADFKKKGEAARIVRETYEKFGQLDLLVLNAAQQISSESLEDLDIDNVEDTFRVNIISMYESIKEADKYMPDGSTVITTTSVQGFKPSTNLFDYAATKAAINNFTINLSQYFAGRGIRVNSVAPGPIWTPIQLDEGSPEGTVPDIGQGTLLGRAGQPVELSDIYVFLASDASSYVTGQIYGITGGDAINL